jgi:hypothetical protein
MSPATSEQTRLLVPARSTSATAFALLISLRVTDEPLLELMGQHTSPHHSNEDDASDDSHYPGHGLLLQTGAMA